jgi:hypothetical protein
MTLEQRLTALATRIGGEAKALRTLINGNAADLAALTTAAKTSLVAAINELQTEVIAAGGAAEVDDGVTDGVHTWSSNKITAEIAAKTEINDALTNLVNTWSSQKITDQIDAAVDAVVAGAPAAIDTLNELAAAIGDDANFAATVTTALGNRVRTDTAEQGLTGVEKSNARTNIGADITSVEIGNPDADHVATFNAALV